EPIEVNIFRGVSPDEDRQRVFGGQVAGQALVAAGRTVDEGEVHSLHAYFLRPGDPNVPILYDVDRIRDGRSFSTRRVVAIQHVWIRPDGELPDDPLLHACVVAYASDLTLLDTTLLPHGRRGYPGVFMASLDHAMWFHRPFRADDWLLYDQQAPSTSGGRGLALGSIFRRDGGLAVSVVQEGLIRVSR